MVEAGDTLRYFAYGSNLCSTRMLARVPAARAVGTGHVRGRRLLFHKLGRDGSGKADARADADPDARVWGVVYAMPQADRPTLDRAEGGYRAVEVEVLMDGGGRLGAFLYEAVASRLDPGLRPYTWYRAYLLDGAREHGLPADYVAALEAVPAVKDPDPGRDRRNRR